MDAPETVEVKTAFFSGKVSSANLNTIFTVLGFALLCMLCYGFVAHARDSTDSVNRVAAELTAANKEVAVALKVANKELSDSLKDMAQATREQTCLISFSQEKREGNAEMCRRISR